jgi:hypothetical protein
MLDWVSNFDGFFFFFFMTQQVENGHEIRSLINEISRKLNSILWKYRRPGS